MGDFLNNIRQRPESERRVIAFSVSGGIIAIIFIVWVTTLITTMTENSRKDQQIVQTEGDNTSTVMKEETENDLSSFLGNVRSGIQELREATKGGFDSIRDFGTPIEYQKESEPVIKKMEYAPTSEDPTLIETTE